MENVNDVANYLIDLFHSCRPEPVDKYKLQKLLFYAQGIHLALKNTPLFEDRIIADCSSPDCGGPIVEQIKLRTADYVRITPMNLEIDTRVFLRQIWELYGKYTPAYLIELTYQEAPWVDAFKENISNFSEVVISHQAMKNYFVTQNIKLPEVPRPVEIKKGRDVFDLKYMLKVLPPGF